MTAVYYPSPRERLADYLLLGAALEGDDHSWDRLSDFAEADRYLTPENVWKNIHEVMEEQVTFFDPDPDLTVQASPEQVTDLNTRLARKGISESWSLPFDSARQRLVMFDPPEAGAADEALPLPASPAPDWRELMTKERNSIGSGGAWWSIPTVQWGFVSSEPQPGLPATELLGSEDDFGDKEAVIRAAIGVTGPVRVWEIDGPADWVRLVDIAPVDVTNSRDGYWGAHETGWRWEIPDWEVIAQEFDAVHVTVNGYLDTSCVPFETGSGARTMFIRWGPGLTVYLKRPPISWGPASRIRRLDHAVWA